MESRMKSERGHSHCLFIYLYILEVKEGDGKGIVKKSSKEWYTQKKQRGS